MSATADQDHTFVVAAYGDSPFLAACLTSLRAQTWPSPVVIATSTPSVFIDAEAARHGVPVVINPTRGGIASDWNFALTATGAARVTLAHQDDLYFPRFAERSLGLMRAHREAVACFTGYEEIDDAGHPRRSKLSLVKHLLERVTLGSRTLAGDGRLRAFLSLGNPLPCSSVTFDRRRLGDFRFSGAYRSNLDWDAWLRLAERGEAFVRTPERLVGRRHNALTETSRLILTGVRRREDLEMFRRLWPGPIADAIAYVYRLSY